MYGPWFQFKDALDNIAATIAQATPQNSIIIDWADFDSSSALTAGAIGDLRYRSLPVGSDTTLTKRLRVPLHWTAYTLWMWVAKVSGEGNVVLGAGSASDLSNQIASGDSITSASPHISTPFTMPVGSTSAVKNQVVAYPVATIQLLETGQDSKIVNIIVERLGTSVLDTFPGLVAFVAAELRIVPSP